MANSFEGYVYGQCTYYAAKMSPWIPANMGNAVDWLVAAKNKGLQTGNMPVHHAVAVFYPSAPGLKVSNDGHVAVVESADFNKGLLTVTDMNWNFVPGKIQTHTVPLKSVAGYIYAPGQSYAQLTANAPSPFNMAVGAVLGSNPVTALPAAVLGAGGNVISDATGALAKSVFGPIIAPMIKGGEVLFGIIFFGLGIWLIVKYADSATGIGQVARTAARFTPVGRVSKLVKG